MTEDDLDNPEQQLSPEQQHLVDTAHALLDIPEAYVSSTHKRNRTTTRNEMAHWVLGKITGQRLPLSNRPQGFYETPAKEITVKRVTVRGLNAEETGTGVWSGGVVLEQELTTNIDTGISTESLLMYASATVNNKEAATVQSSYKEEKRWQVSLLDPIIDSSRIPDLQNDLDAGISRYSKPEAQV